MITWDEATKTYSVMSGPAGTNPVIEKSGFKTRQEARNYELSITDFSSVDHGNNKFEDATFDDLYRAFIEEKSVRVRQSTMVGYKVIGERFFVPAFSGKKLNEISPVDVRAWQNGMIRLDYSTQYLRRIDSLLSTIFKYGVRFFGMKENPSLLAGTVGSFKTKHMNFWTIEEFNRFMCYVRKPRNKVIFDTLYWTGLRVGELLALTPDDIDMSEHTIRVNKTYKRYHSQDIISPPKTKKSNRVVFIHDSLLEELKEYIKNNPQIGHDERLFPICFYSIRDTMMRTCRKAGVKRIKIHDLRHSHASFLINMNVTPLIVSERLGHEKVETTLNIYSHLYPDVQRKLAEELEKEFSRNRADSDAVRREQMKVAELIGKKNKEKAGSNT